MEVEKGILFKHRVTLRTDDGEQENNLYKHVENLTFDDLPQINSIDELKFKSSNPCQIVNVKGKSYYLAHVADKSFVQKNFYIKEKSDALTTDYWEETWKDQWNSPVAEEIIEGCKYGILVLVDIANDDFNNYLTNAYGLEAYNLFEKIVDVKSFLGLKRVVNHAPKMTREYWRKRFDEGRKIYLEQKDKYYTEREQKMNNVWVEVSAPGYRETMKGDSIKRLNEYVEKLEQFGWEKM